MKSSIFTIALFTAFNALATIEGPSCESLSQEQRDLLFNAARNYTVREMGIDLTVPSNSLSELDCHDYDGVHSNSEFMVEWTKELDENKKMRCAITVSVEVNYDPQTKRKVIESDSKFFVTDMDDMSCEQ